MSNVAHSSLSGADLHEPKGIGSAAAGTAYIADGAGSGTWSSLASVTGRVGEVFMWAGPLVPSGALECDGSAVSRTTYADLFSALTITKTGTRTSGSAVVTSLGDTTGWTVGMPLSGTGIPAGTTIASVDSGTQITMSANATSSGTASVVIAPHGVGNGTTTFNLPNFTDTGRYPRSRIVSASTDIHVGKQLSSQNKSHNHGGITGNQSAQHSHGVTDAGHIHGGGDLFDASSSVNSGPDNTSITVISAVNNTGAGNTASATTGISINNSTTDHTHTISDDGGLEARPDTTVLMFCIKV